MPPLDAADASESAIESDQNQCLLQPLTKTQSEKNVKVNVLVKEKNENYYSFHDSTDSVREAYNISSTLASTKQRKKSQKKTVI